MSPTAKPLSGKGLRESPGRSLALDGVSAQIWAMNQSAQTIVVPPAPRVYSGVNWIGFQTLYFREVKRFFKVVTQTVLAPVVTTLLYMLIFVVAMSGTRASGLGVDFAHFVGPGLIMMSIMNNAFANSSSSLLQAKMMGLTPDFLTPPLSSTEQASAFAAGAMTRGVFVGVVNAVATLAKWGSPAKGSAQGLAFLKGFGSYIAVIAEVSKTGTGTAAKLKVNKLSVAIDCGTVVNPDSVTAQLEGGLIHGMAATLWQQALFNNGVPVSSNFNKYRVARLSDVPQIATTIVASTQNPGGVGETGVPCVAPAIANAWARLTGIRQRSLPFFPGSTMSDG